MMKIELIYFSGAGNTAYLAALFAKMLREAEHDVNSHALEKLPPNWQAPICDMIGFGGPVHFCEPPRNCLEFLRRLDGRNLPLFTFWTTGLYAGDCGRIFQLAAQKQGFRPIADFVGVFPGVDFVMELPRKSLLNYFNMRIEPRLVGRVYEFVQTLDAESPTRINRRRWYVPLNDRARKIGMRRYDGFRRNLHSLCERCSQCDWCVRNCPVGAIHRREQGLQFEPEHCLFCLRCYHGCPTEAIQIGEKTLDHGRYAGPHQARRYVPIGDYDPSSGKPKTGFNFN